MIVKALLIDLEGTLYYKGEQIPGAAQALQAFRQRGLLLRFLTNTDSKTPHIIQPELARMGLTIPTEEIFSPVVALQEFLRCNPTKSCYFLLSDELAGELAVSTTPREQADYVVVGDCRARISYETLNDALRCLMNGAELIALQKGRYFIRTNGYNLDTGAFVTGLEYASGKTARVLGKPAPDFFNLALRSIDCYPSEVAIIGDDLTTDIIGARQIGATAVLVKTGKFSEAMLAESCIKPDLVATSIADLPQLLDVLKQP